MLATFVALIGMIGTDYAISFAIWEIWVHLRNDTTVAIRKRFMQHR